jgi:hypothetical protein
VTVDQLASDEPLSPELVLVLPPELRAQALATLGPPVWQTPTWRAIPPPLSTLQTLEPLAQAAAPVPASITEDSAPSLPRMIVARVVQLAVVFVAVTALTLAMSVVARAVHSGGQLTVPPKARPERRDGTSRQLPPGGGRFPQLKTGVLSRRGTTGGRTRAVQEGAGGHSLRGCPACPLRALAGASVKDR